MELSKIQSLPVSKKSILAIKKLKSKFQKVKRRKKVWVPKSQKHSYQHSKSELWLGCWNIRTLIYQGKKSDHPKDKRPIIVEEAKRLQLDLLLLSETRLLGTDNIEINDYTLIWSGRSKFFNGVAVLIKNNDAKKAQLIHAESDRIIYLRLRIN